MTQKLFSVDDHIVEPAHVWTSRLPAAYQEAGPHVVEEDGKQFWEVEGVRATTMGLNAVAGKDRTEWGMEPARFSDMIPGCYDPVARSKDLRSNGLVGSVLFPTLPGFGGRKFADLKDKALADLCVKAYNDFVIDEWCAADPTLYVPTIICQLWDPTLAAAEVRRCAAKGARSLTFPENTVPLGLPSVHRDEWHPLWEAVCETEMVISMHGGSSGRMPLATPESHFAMALIGVSGMFSLEVTSDLMLSPITHLFPGLKFVITEGGAGWAPYLLERAETEWELHRHWWKMDESPVEVFRRHIWLCLVNERFAVESRDRIGVDKLLWECDYPHADTPWPNAQAEAKAQFEGVPQKDVDAMTWQNAAELFHWPVAN
jgi:predicted TIM-barrel fold metal-dependent hydrolase